MRFVNLWIQMHQEGNRVILSLPTGFPLTYPPLMVRGREYIFLLKNMSKISHKDVTKYSLFHAMLIGFPMEGKSLLSHK